MSKEYYRKQMVGFRAQIEKEKEAKKRDNEHFAKSIKSSSIPANKEMYRKAKISAAAKHDKNIESIKKKIDDCKKNIAKSK